MRIISTTTAAILAATASLALSAPAHASTQEQPGDPQISGQPDTSQLHDEWTFAPLGVPLFGLIDSARAVPGKIIPGGGTGPGGGN